MKDCAVGIHYFNAPITCVHTLTAVGAKARGRIRLNSEIDILPQLAIPIPPVVHAHAPRRGNSCVEVQRVSGGGIRHGLASPLTARDRQTLTDRRLDHSRTFVARW